MTGKRSALLVATGLYQDATFRQLRAPSADVEALGAVLADPAIGGYEVGLLSNAVSHQVNQAIERFFAEASLKDLIMLYFSGHGFKDDSGRLYLITTDSQRGLLGSTAVSAQFVREQLDRCRSRRKVVVLDCCYAGAFPDGVARSTDTVDVLESLSGRGSIVITASSGLGYAFESGASPSVTAIDDVATPSVFTSALIDGLATGSADQDGDGLVGIDELYDHVYKKVRETVPQQTPGRRGNVEGALYVATSPRGPRPAQLSSEFSDAVQNPLPSVRLAVVSDLLTLCSGARPGTVMAVQSALNQLAEDDSRRVAAAARSALDAISERLDQAPVGGHTDTTAPTTPASLAGGRDHSKDDVAGRPSGDQGAIPVDLIAAAESEAEAIKIAGQRQAEELMSKTEHEAAKLRAIADHEVAEKRAIAERDIAKLRTTTEREVAQLKASAKRTRDDILATAKEQAEQIRSEAGEAQGEMIQMLREAEQLLDSANKSIDMFMARIRQLEVTPGGMDVGDLQAQKDIAAGELARIRTVLVSQISTSGNTEMSESAARVDVPEFEIQMRGYSRRQVDEYIARLAEDPNLSVPDFEIQMRGYSRTQVDHFLKGFHGRETDSP